jgi:hypothetical protein
MVMEGLQCLNSDHLALDLLEVKTYFFKIHVMRFNIFIKKICSSPLGSIIFLFCFFHINIINNKLLEKTTKIRVLAGPLKFMAFAQIQPIKPTRQASAFTL